MKHFGKNFSILGDSISTYEGHNPTKNEVFYMFGNRFDANLSSWHETWWGQVLKHFDGTLLVNESWSGSLVSDIYEKPKCSCGCSDERTGNLDSMGEKPDCILVYMGTNDSGWRVQPKSEDKDDLSVFENAYSAMLDKIKKNYPLADIWCCTISRTKCSAIPNQICGSERRISHENVYCDIIKAVAEEKNCHVIDFHDGSITVDTIDGLHPNKCGMTEIAGKVIAALETAE